MANSQDEQPFCRKMQYKEYKGTYMFDCAEIEDFPSFKCRDDDVWVCSFPRSGTTLTQQITYLIMRGDFEKARTVDLDDRFPTCDVYDEGFPLYRGLKYLDGLPADEPRLIKSHIHHFLLPDELKNGKGKIVYITRNPKASITSLFKVLNYINNPPAATLREYIEMFLTGKDVYTCPWGLHVRQFWERRNDDNVLFIQFEKLIRDRRRTIKKIADFLGKDLTDEQLDKIEEATTLENMKSNPSTNFGYFEEAFKTDKSEGAFINTGEIGGWKRDVPEDLAKRIDDMIQRELGHTDISYD